jgi:hypothetical protein
MMSIIFKQYDIFLCHTGHLHGGLDIGWLNVSFVKFGSFLTSMQKQNMQIKNMGSSHKNCKY